MANVFTHNDNDLLDVGWHTWVWMGLACAAFVIALYAFSGGGVPLEQITSFVETTTVP